MIARSDLWDIIQRLKGKIAYALPFAHAVELERAVISGNYSGIFPHFWWVLGYAVAMVVISILVFTHKMRKK